MHFNRGTIFERTIYLVKEKNYNHLATKKNFEQFTKNKIIENMEIKCCNWMTEYYSTDITILSSEIHV